MDPKRVATIHGATRVAVGAALVVAPTASAKGWIGSDAGREPVTVFARALGVRDATMGLGVLRSLGDGEAVKAWVAACVVADAVDLGATLAVRGRLPAAGAVAISAVAASSALLGAWLLAALD